MHKKKIKCGQEDKVVVEDFEITLPFGVLAAKAWGNNTSFPVLALHGWKDNAMSFFALGENLPTVRLVAIDFPGHGLSSHYPPGSHYYYEDFVFCVLAAADALGWKKFSLLGHSLGAAVATTVAAIVPDRIVNLLLIDGLGPAVERSVSYVKKLRKIFKSGFVHNKHSRILFNSVSEAVDIYQRVTGLDYQLALPIVQRNLEATAGGLMWRTDSKLNAQLVSHWTQETVVSSIKEITSPALLLKASSGVLKSRDYMQERYNNMHTLKIVELEGGHYIHMQDPATVAKHILPFIEDAQKEVSSWKKIN